MNRGLRRGFRTERPRSVASARAEGETDTVAEERDLEEKGGEMGERKDAAATRPTPKIRDSSTVEAMPRWALSPGPSAPSVVATG